MFCSFITLLRLQRVFLFLIFAMLFFYKCLELLATILHVLKEVEASTAWTQQYGVAWLCKLLAGCYTILHAVGIAYRDAEFVEIVMQLLVVCAEIYDAHALLFHQVFDLVVIIALVLAAYDEDSWGLHALQGIPACIYIGSL